MKSAPAILAELENYLKREAITKTQFAERSGIHSGTLGEYLPNEAMERGWHRYRAL
ncbi:hypothetical protein K3T49_26095 [Paenibacillus sonchi]|nr:hypothetical protein [Paenibacillus sonchi]